MEPQIISSGLYKITNNVNGKCYIGITKHSPEKRFLAHIASAKKGSNTALHRSMRKYGFESFSCKQLVICKPGQYLKDLEVKAIAGYGTKFPNGYNLTAGGDGVVDGSPEVAEKIRQSRKLNPPTLTEQGKLLISEAGKRAWADPDHKAKRSANIKKGLSVPEVHEARCAAIKQASSSEIGREIKRDVSRKLWETTEYRDKVNAAALAGMRTPQAKANRSAAAKAAWAKRKAV